MNTSNTRKVIKDPLELVIPPPILDKSHYLKTTKEGDVSRSYNITLKTPGNKDLFIESEENLRDLLQEYLNYRKCQKEIEENLSKQRTSHSKDKVQPENQNQNKKKRVTKRTTKITRVEYYRPAEDSEASVSDISKISGQIPVPREHAVPKDNAVPRDNERPCCSQDCKGISHEKKRCCCEIL